MVPNQPRRPDHSAAPTPGPPFERDPAREADDQQQQQQQPDLKERTRLEARLEGIAARVGIAARALQRPGIEADARQRFAAGEVTLADLEAAAERLEAEPKTRPPADLRRARSPWTPPDPDREPERWRRLYGDEEV